MSQTWNKLFGTTSGYVRKDIFAYVSLRMGQHFILLCREAWDDRKGSLHVNTLRECHGQSHGLLVVKAIFTRGGGGLLVSSQVRAGYRSPHLLTLPGNSRRPHSHHVRWGVPWTLLSQWILQTTSNYIIHKVHFQPDNLAKVICIQVGRTSRISAACYFVAVPGLLACTFRCWRYFSVCKVLSEGDTSD